MKKYLFIISALLAIGCAEKGKGTHDPIIKPDSLDIELSVSFTGLTKAIMEDDGSLKWEAGDELAVWDGEKLCKMTVGSGNLTSDPGTVKFKMTVPYASPRISVIYPYDENNVIDGNRLVTGSQRVELGTVMKSQLKAVGFCTPANPEAALHNFNTVMRFRIDDDNVRGISIQGNDKEVLLYRSEINLADGSMSFHPVSMNYTRLYLTAVPGKGTYYFGMLPGVKFEHGYTLKFYSQPSMTRYNLVGTVSTSDRTELASGSLLDLGVLDIQPKEKDKYANCYVVSRSGTYSILPVKGNSEVAVGEVASASLLWETVNTAKAPAVNSVISAVGYDAASGLINYTATGTKGNAVIAAKDASGNILWSWHIWNAQESIASLEIGDSRAMDRNLGALSAEGDLSAGLMYEWGRKDPFLGASALQGGAGLIAATADVNSKGTVSSNGSTGTVAYSIANPATWIQAAAAPWDWIYGTEINDLWDAEKTIYDPCPAGYHVPSSDMWTFVESVPFPLSGRFRVNGKGFNSDPGKQTSYWLSNVTNTHAQCLFVETDGSCSFGTVSRGTGCPVRCIED